RRRGQTAKLAQLCIDVKAWSGEEAVWIKQLFGGLGVRKTQDGVGQTGAAGEILHHFLAEQLAQTVHAGWVSRVRFVDWQVNRVQFGVDFAGTGENEAPDARFRRGAQQVECAAHVD